MILSDATIEMIETHRAFNYKNPIEWYIVMFYFIQTTFTNIGFGDIYPNSDTERVVTMCISVTGFVMLNGYLIGALSSVLIEKSRRLSNLRFRLSLIQHELENRKVPAATIKKVLRFYHSLWISRRGAASVNKMLIGLPRSLSSQVYLDIFFDALNTSLLFRSCNEFSKRAVARVMSIELFMAGDVILKRSEINSKMFYIRKGTIQIMSYQDDETQIMTFGAGTVFGQCSLLLSLPARSQVHAATFCEIHTLTRRNLFFVLADYPDAKDTIQNVHQNLLLNVLSDKFTERVLDEPLPYENVLTVRSFYKEPPEASKLARDDICIVTRFPYTFMPDTIFLRAWNVIHGILIVVISFYYPYCAAFTRKYPKDYESFILLVDMLYYLDVYLTFSTAVNKRNILLTTLKQIAIERFSKIYVFVDITACLPIHYFVRDQRVKPVVLCLRCLKLYKIPLLFAQAEYNLNWSMIDLIRLLKYVLYFVFGAYAMGLAYYMEACYVAPCGSDSWYATYVTSLYKGNPVIVCMYFAIMVISGTGYGDITVNQTKEILWVLFFFFVGVFLFCYLISEYSAHLSLGREPRQNFTELTDIVNAFLIRNKMLTSERIRVRQYLNLQWEMNQAYEFSYEGDLFHDTPTHLTYDITLNTRRKGIHSMELFHGMNDTILTAILHSSYRKLLPPHEVVIYAGEVCSTLLIVEDGYCEMTFGKDVSVKKIVGPGENICTVELFLGLTAAYHVRTLTHCIMLKVRKSDLRRALALNPLGAKELDTTIQEFRRLAAIKALRAARPIRLHLQVRPPLQKSVFRFPYYRKQSGNKELRDPFLRLGFCQGIRFLLLSFTILPYGKWLKRWELSRCVFALFSALLFPSLPYLQLQRPYLYYLAWFLDVMAWIDLYFRLHVGYYNDRKLLISHPLSTSAYYMKGAFALDFVFCFPFDRIMHRPVPDSEGEILASVESIDILRFLRVGQIHRISPTLTNLGMDFLSNPSIFLVMTMLAGFTAIFLNILTSFLFLTVVNYKVKPNGKYEVYYIDDQVKEGIGGLLHQFGLSSKPFEVYTLLLYWSSVTAFGVGFGDIYARTEELMIFIIVVILLSYLYFNYVTIIIASHLASVNFNLTVYQKRLTHLIEFLEAEKIDPILKQHTINHFEHVWKKTKGMEAETVFSNFNVALKDDVMMHLYEDTLRGVPAFSKMNPSFFRVLSNRLKELYYQAGAAVFKRGDIITLVHIIHHGEVTLVGKNEDQTKILHRSRIFGHVEKIERSLSRVSAVATKNLHVLCISAVDFYQIIDEISAETTDDLDADPHRSDSLATSLSNPEQELLTSQKDEGKGEAMSSTRSWFVHTSYRFSKKLLTLYMVISYMSVNLVSYHLAFQSRNIFLIALGVPIEIVYISKIYLGFNTGFYDEAGEFVTDLRRIKRRYMSITGFYLDFFTVIPFEIFALVAESKERLYVASALRMTKILRIYNIWTFFNQKFDKLNVNMVILKLFAMSVWTSTLLHLCTCVWYMVSCPKDNCPKSKVWTKAIEELRCKDRYLCSLYFVIIVLTTTGFGDITPISVHEILFVILLMFIAKFYMAIFIGQMVSTIQKSLFSKTNYEFETETLKDFLNANDVTPSLKKSILKYVNDLWTNEKGQQIPELIQHAPNYLSSEIKLAAYGHHIHENPVFKSCNASLRKQLVNGLKRTIYFPGNVIVHEGEVDATMYFVHSGQVGIRGRGKKKKALIYASGDWFGMKQGIRRREAHIHTFYAKSVCVILSLCLGDWEYLVDFYATDIRHIITETDIDRDAI